MIRDHLSREREPRQTSPRKEPPPPADPVDYKDQLLSKFNIKFKGMTKEEPKEFLSHKKPATLNPRDDRRSRQTELAFSGKSDIKSVDRLLGFKEKEQIEQYCMSAKSWEMRRGRSQKSTEMSHKDVQSRYREAFRNISQELKKKMVAKQE